MKKIIIVLIVLSFEIFAGAFLEWFTAKSDGNNVTLSWFTSSEENLKEFIVLRGTDKDNLSEIGTVDAKGDNSLYKFTDENAYKENESFYVYRLRLVDSDGNYSYSGIASVTHNVSSVKRTWGSIKALFR